MKCPECKGRGYIKLFRHGRMPCLECGGSGVIAPKVPTDLDPAALVEGEVELPPPGGFHSLGMAPLKLGGKK